LTGECIRIEHRFLVCFVVFTLTDKAIDAIQIPKD
jgi:hypothetical protein